eukprot:CAMPEP_0201475972 /NCGR_PEP_ID=MMETSP0151_2-20130828/1270_1 /ASSEMBLY_ACC=CAM_ASM_000257 /TAXON_ID=200890 /ORGANISM="Paramoeba atlantica, Strain 621/1 / CCAP 1560/9" /LENGTH=93 /DNA_ID=CAMNT_0047856197 /DNA_START=56 /DNA_END=337 /DNA_ORIENTATION=-
MPVSINLFPIFFLFSFLCGRKLLQSLWNPVQDDMRSPWRSMNTLKKKTNVVMLPGGGSIMMKEGMSTMRNSDNFVLLDCPRRSLSEIGNYKSS